jgi:hypothetical protein
MQIKPKYHLRPKKPQFFLDNLNINYKDVKPNMTTGAQVYFKNYRDKKKCIKILSNINLNQKYFFKVQDYKENKIFYKFNVYSNKNYINLDRINYKDFDEFHPTYNLNNLCSKKILIKQILKNVNLIKSTSEHINEGLIYSKNFQISKNRIKSTELINYIKKYINKY